MPTSSSLADDVQLPRIHHGYFRNFNSHGKILVYNKLEMKMLILLNFFFFIFCEKIACAMALERYFGIRHGYFYMLHFSPQRARFV